MSNTTKILIRKNDGTLITSESFNIISAPDLVTSIDTYSDVFVIIGYFTGNETDLKCCVSKASFDTTDNVFNQIGLSKRTTYNYVGHWYEEQRQVLTVASLYDPKARSNKKIEIFEYDFKSMSFKVMLDEELQSTEYLTVLHPKFHKNNTNQTSVLSFILSDDTKIPKQVLMNVFLKHYKDRCVVDRFININTDEIVFKEDTKPYNSVLYVSDALKGEPPFEFKKYSEGNRFLVRDSNTLRKDDYLFKGWQDVQTSVVYNSNDLFTMPASSVTFSADWNPVVTVSYDLSGASGLTPSDNTKYIEGDTITIKDEPKAILEGYKFHSWTDGDSEYPAESELTLTTVSSPSSIVLSAQWHPEVFLYYYGAQEPDIFGYNPVDLNTYVKGMSATVQGKGTLASSTSSFSAWWDGTESYTQGSIIVMDTENITLSAVWEI